MFFSKINLSRRSFSWVKYYGFLPFILGFAATSHASHPTRGYIESVKVNEYGSVTIAGWACAMGIKKPIYVDVYLGRTMVNRTLADTPSKTILRAGCGGAGLNHRFNIVLNPDVVAANLNKKIYMYGINDYELPFYFLPQIGRSGHFKVPKTVIDHRNNGYLESVVSHYDRSVTVTGWACAMNSPDPIYVDVYFGMNMVNRSLANAPSETALDGYCKSTGMRYRFSIDIPAEVVAANTGKKVYVYGINLFGWPNAPISNSGTLSLP